MNWPIWCQHPCVSLKPYNLLIITPIFPLILLYTYSPSLHSNPVVPIYLMRREPISYFVISFCKMAHWQTRPLKNVANPQKLRRKLVRVASIPKASLGGLTVNYIFPRCFLTKVTVMMKKSDTASENTILFLLVCRTLQTKAAPLKMKTLLLHVDMPISTIVMTLIVRQIRSAEGLYPFSISNNTCSLNL